MNDPVQFELGQPTKHRQDRPPVRRGSVGPCIVQRAAPLFSFNRRIVIDRAAALGLPAIYEWPEMAEEGGLIGYSPRLNLIYRQAARLLAKVLGGAKHFRQLRFAESLKPEIPFTGCSGIG